ncbi:MAG: amidophosphoribosyltransferase [Candidatus ainarchaeum sp.]|nr:amidophosphoribosyltransferase [Candidatus ainarchaeum sp.]
MAIRDSCGVFGACSPNHEYKAAWAVYNGLVGVQHRGQDSCGICALDGGRLELEKGRGLVSEAFTRERLDGMRGQAAIGHVRYPTTGSGGLENAQPYVARLGDGKEYAFSFNGNIANYLELKRELEAQGEKFHLDTEIELVARMLAMGMSGKGKAGAKATIYDAAGDAMGRLDGSYSILILCEDGKLYAWRDPQGFKPFCFGKDAKGNWFFASESCALEALRVTEFSDVRPGEIIMVEPGKEPVRTGVVKPERVTHCQFEYLYFARGDSVIEGVLCNEVRQKLGGALAGMHPVKADFVVPVPDSGKSFALGYARASGIPYEEGLMKNRYIHRTFIMPEQEMREKAVRAKLNPVKKFVAGKRIVLVDDSIVRGTTLREIVRLVRDAGALEIHVRIGCPPVVAPCYMGMDFPTYKELAAANKSVEEIRVMLGADSLGYTDLAALNKAIGLDGRLCMACLTGDYPLKRQPAKNAVISCG